MSEQFGGVPIEDLRIDFVDWTHRGEYIRSRSDRRPGETGVEPEWATEAAVGDVNRLISIRGSRSGRSIRVVGWSPTAELFLTVILVPKDIAAGEWWGANAWTANETDRRIYRTQEHS